MDHKKSLMDLPLEDRLRILGLLEPPTPADLARWREWGKWLDEFQKKVGPIDIPADELVHMTPEEVDAKYGGRPS